MIVADEPPRGDNFPIATYALWLLKRQPDMTQARAETASVFNITVGEVSSEQMTFVIRRKFWNDEVFWKTLQEGGYV